MTVLYTTVTGASLALAVHRETILRWLATGLLSGVRHRRAIASYERQPLGGAGHWRVSVDSIEALLASALSGAPVPVAVRRRLRQLGKPLPHVP